MALAAKMKEARQTDVEHKYRNTQIHKYTNTQIQGKEFKSTNDESILIQSYKVLMA